MSLLTDHSKISNNVLSTLNKKLCIIQREGRRQEDFVVLFDRRTIQSILIACNITGTSVSSPYQTEEDELKVFKINGFEGRIICDEGIGFIISDLKEV